MPSTPSHGPAAPRWRGRSCVVIPPIKQLIADCRASRWPTVPPIPRSSRTGGCTFPEDPMHSCAEVQPMWSAAVDPRVIIARASPLRQAGERAFDSSGPGVRVLRGFGNEYLLADRGGSAIRLDIVEGSVLAGPVTLRYDIPDDTHLELRLSAIRAFTAAAQPRRQHLQLARRVQALHATDARNGGASLREIADLVLGAGDWPGDGEHRKSLVRRLIIAGDRMLHEGHRAILGCRLNPLDQPKPPHRRSP